MKTTQFLPTSKTLQRTLVIFSGLTALLLGSPLPAHAISASCLAPKFSGCAAAKPAFLTYQSCWQRQFKSASVTQHGRDFCCGRNAPAGTKCDLYSQNYEAHLLASARCAAQLAAYSQAVSACP